MLSTTTFNNENKTSMIKTRIKLLMTFLIFLPFGIYCQNIDNTSPAKVLASDLALVIGNWEGTLTYLDYSTGKPYTMPANLVMTQGKNEFQLNGAHVFPNEPKANSSFKLKVSKDGTQLNKKTITSRKILQDGQIQITTEYEGKDGNEQKMAIIRITYTVGSDNYSVRKEVQFVGSTNWILRNEYKYRKK